MLDLRVVGEGYFTSSAVCPAIGLINAKDRPTQRNPCMMDRHAQCLAKVISLLEPVTTGKAVGHDTRILSELDLDSLAMLEFVEALKAEFGVDFLAPPRSLAELSSPRTIADALCGRADEAGGSGETR